MIVEQQKKPGERIEGGEKKFSKYMNRLKPALLALAVATTSVKCTDIGVEGIPAAEETDGGSAGADAGTGGTMPNTGGSQTGGMDAGTGGTSMDGGEGGSHTGTGGMDAGTGGTAGLDAGTGGTAGMDAGTGGMDAGTGGMDAGGMGGDGGSAGGDGGSGGMDGGSGGSGPVLCPGLTNGSWTGFISTGNTQNTNGYSFTYDGPGAGGEALLTISCAGGTIESMFPFPFNVITDYPDTPNSKNIRVKPLVVDPGQTQVNIVIQNL